MEPGLNLLPGDPTRSLSVCGLNFDDGVLLLNAFCQKSLVYGHTYRRRKCLTFVNLLSIEK